MLQMWQADAGNTVKSQFLWEAVDLNTNLRKILNGGDLTQRLLTCGHLN
jgi:hypothetical protein